MHSQVCPLYVQCSAEKFTRSAFCVYAIQWPLIARSALCVYKYFADALSGLPFVCTIVPMSYKYHEPNRHRRGYRANLYHFYRSLIPMSWQYVRDLRLNIRMSTTTRGQMDQVKRIMADASPSDADVVAWAVSLLNLHMREHVLSDEGTFPEKLRHLDGSEKPL